MAQTNVHISSAISSELSEIEQLARSLDLDVQDLSFDQFVTAKRGERIIGFGRIKTYDNCREIATVGVVREEQNKGTGANIVRRLLRDAGSEMYVTCVIPEFFRKLGFEQVKQYPSVLQKKVDFCKLYDYKENEIFVMRIESKK